LHRDPGSVSRPGLIRWDFSHAQRFLASIPFLRQFAELRRWSSNGKGGDPMPVVISNVTLQEAGLTEREAIIGIAR